MKATATAICLLLIGALSTSLFATQEDPVEESRIQAQAESPAEEGDAAVDSMAEDEAAATVSPEEAAVVLMNPRWAELACEAWNENSTLTDGLAAPGWVANNKDRGYKVIQIYRTDCEASPWVELHIADRDSKALCVYGGPVKTEELISGVDYIMHAQTPRWQEMGAGDYGPMKGMMTGRLKFKGPKWEAMKNMGPFSSFLQLTGEVDSDASVCPEE